MELSDCWAERGIRYPPTQHMYSDSLAGRLLVSTLTAMSVFDPRTGLSRAIDSLDSLANFIVILSLAICSVWVTMEFGTSNLRGRETINPSMRFG